MNHAKTYHTKQQKAILQFIANDQQGYVTASQIAAHLKESGCSVGLTTIYRQLERFQKEGIVQKIVLDGNSGACFQYIGQRNTDGSCQFLLKCEDCGKITNMGCGHMNELYSHVLEEHHFNVNPHRTMFYGTCRECLQGELQQDNQGKKSQGKKSQTQNGKS